MTMIPSHDYTLEMLKVNSAVWLHNYRATGRLSYLNHAMAATREALQIYSRQKRSAS